MENKIVIPNIKRNYYWESSSSNDDKRVYVYFSDIKNKVME